MAKQNLQKDAAKDLPYNEQAEQAVLGSALLSSDALFTMLSSLYEEDFFEGKHQLIYRVMKNLTEKNSVVDTLTVTEELINIKEYDNIGGVEYLKVCCDSMVALSALRFYINIVRDQSTLRKLLESVRAIDKNYRNEEIDDVTNFITTSEQMIKDATERRRSSEFRSAEEVSEVVKMQLNKPKQEITDGVTGLTTGLSL